MNTSLPPIIFDQKLLSARKKNIDDANFLRVEAKNSLHERIKDIRREFGSVLELQRGEEFAKSAENSFDLVKSSLVLHWVNDVVGFLLSAKRVLRPDGFFVANFFGGSTLNELKNIFQETDKNALSARISPFIDVKDAGQLLQRAGFALPVVDSETIEVSYENMFALMKHLKKIGENNALVKRRKNFTGKDFMLKAAELYAKNYSDDEGRIIATFEIITISAWKPAASQQKPLVPGSAKTSLKEVL